MPHINKITSMHIKKLGHSIDEIRIRALDNVISKFDLGFGCDCDAVKKELIVKLFNWFSFETIPQPGKVLDLLLRLVKVNHSNYLNTFGKQRFQNELSDLRRRLDCTWHDKLNEIEEAVLSSEKYRPSSDNGPPVFSSGTNDGSDTYAHKIYNSDRSKDMYYKGMGDSILNNGFNQSASIDSTIPFDLTLQGGDGMPVAKIAEGGIRWSVMPWQSLVTSDKGVFAAVEEALSNTLDTSLIYRTCQFITNVMLQDFPAEVFLQRPSIIHVLHTLLEGSANNTELNVRCIISAVLKALYKLTRSLRFRIYYYCDPCIANTGQKLLAGKGDSNTYMSSEARDSPDGGIPEANYQAYQSTGTSERSHSVLDNVDDSVLQLQQMLIPIYCIETLKHAIAQLSIPVDPTFPLKNIKYIMDLSHELTQLLIISVMPNIWLCHDGVALKISEDLKTLFALFGEVLDYFGNYNNIDHFRITYLHLLSMTVKLLSSVVPLELANNILPNLLKTSMTRAVMDCPLYLMYPSLHSTLQQYAYQFKGAGEVAQIKLYDETRIIVKSMKAAISLMKGSSEEAPSQILQTIYASKISLSYHKNLSVINKTIKFLQNVNKYSFNEEDRTTVTKLTLCLLANGDTDIQYAMYAECLALVKSILGVEFNREGLSWENLAFLLEPNVLTELICHGARNENEKIKEMAEDILVYTLKGRVQMGETGWLRLLEAVIPVLPHLQCYAHSTTPLGKCVTKMLDPDVSSIIQLPQIEVLKGNLRLLYSPESDIREEALCRIIYLLGKEPNSTQKLPHLSSLHGLPLSSLCILDRQSFVKRSEGNYQRSNLMSVLEMLNTPDIDPKMRKSALVQISVMLSDTSLHQLFIRENGLPLVLDIFRSALIEKNYLNYPDSVIPILTILKLLVSTESLVRQELSTRMDVLLNIIRSLFLFPNNECAKIDGSQLLCLLLYNECILRVSDKNIESNINMNISLPYIIVSKMRLPFVCKSHWKTSTHRRSDSTMLHSSNQAALSFIRQYWAWTWNDGTDMLWKHLEDINNAEISEKLMLQESELSCLQYSYLYYYCQQQLFNIQNSTTHDAVTCALDYLTMYLKLHKIVQCEENENMCPLPWEQTFERFLQCHPTSKEDCNLFVDVLNFLQLSISITKYENLAWIHKIIKSLTKSLADLFNNLELNNQDIHQSILKLARTCCIAEKSDAPSSDTKDTWITFIDLLVSNLCFGDQQHFYNLAYLDWLLTCLTYLIGQCQWSNHKNLLISLGNALIELIISFHGAGAISFMGLSITRNSIICLNHLLHQIQINFDKHSWYLFWYDEGRTLSWLPILWQARDPLVRASALQLLVGLTNVLHTASQLLNALSLAPSELCHTLLRCITNREESCIVKEQACMAFNNLVKNSTSVTFQYTDSLQSAAILIYAEQSNLYYEISLLCSNVYPLPNLDFGPHVNESGQIQYTHSGISGSGTIVPRTVSYRYNCHDDSQPLSAKDSDNTDLDNYLQLIVTPSLATALCTLLNNLIIVGQQEVIRQIYEHSIDKYFLGCLTGIPTNVDSKRDLTIYCDVLEMYIGICTVLTNCITNSNEFTATSVFSRDSIYTLFTLLNPELYHTQTSHLVYLRNRLWTEIYNLIAVLSLGADKHFETVEAALELCTPGMVLTSICTAIKDTATELRMSAIGCLAFLLLQEIQRVTLDKSNFSIQTVLDTCEVQSVANNRDSHLRNVISSVNKLSIRNASFHTRKSADNDEEDMADIRAKDASEEWKTIGAELCGMLLHLFIAHSYARSKKSRKQTEDKDLIMGTLSNLLCVSKEAKRVALEENLPQTALMILKELYVKLNLQPFEVFKNQLDREKKVHPLLHDVNAIFALLMNFIYGSEQIKQALTNEGLADVVHKLWAWVAVNKNTSTSALKLLATFTTKCPAAAQSLTLTTTLPGTGLRKSPSTIALIHVIIHLIGKEIEKAGRMFDNQKLHFAFHILRNAVHVHECRVSISKSNLLQFFNKIHPVTTKRTKPWPLIELYCLEFLIDFTYYEEGQLCVPKVPDGLDVLICLAKCHSSSTKILAISILRNLAFNVANRPRLLSSVDFINLLHDVFKNGSSCEIRIAGAMLWSLVCNNQKGKLVARSAGFSQSIREALSRLTLLSTEDAEQEQDLIKMLQYVISILSPSEQ